MPLNANGREQASAAGRVFAEQQVRFDRVIVSGLPRTVETAQRVLAETGQHIALEIWPAFEEIRGGKLGGIADRGYRGRFSRRVRRHRAARARTFSAAKPSAHCSIACCRPSRALREDRSWDTVLLVLHGGVNRAILSHAITAGERDVLRPSVAGDRLHQRARRRRTPRATGWCARSNYSPPSPLHRDVRNTTMEMLYAQFIRYNA